MESPDNLFSWPIPVVGDLPPRPDAELLDRLKVVSAATASARMHHLGIRRAWIQGPQPLRTGMRAVGVALTLQLMPQREDIASGSQQEYIEKHTALWKVLEQTQPGDLLVIQANGAARTGCVGEMLARYFRGRGGVGMVVDGRIRDTAGILELGVPMWTLGSTPHYASQDESFPWAYNVPVAVGGALVLPHDIVIADADGAVVVPRQLAEQLADEALRHEDWEAFTREKLDAGHELSRYYPLNEETRREYEAARAAELADR